MRQSFAGVWHPVRQSGGDLPEGNAATTGAMGLKNTTFPY